MFALLFALWIVVGLGVGWGGGRLLALNGNGVASDLIAGVVGSVSVAWALQSMHPGAIGGSLEAVLGGVAGALAATFVCRSYADRYHRVTGA